MDNNFKYSNLFNEVNNSGLNFIQSGINITPIPPKGIKRLLICGMGGSGITGDYIKLLNRNDDITIITIKDYNIPIINSDDFGIVISYSGNTEETISMFEKLRESNTNFVTISSGGILEEYSKKYNILHHPIINNLQPRAAFPHILGTVYGLTCDLLKLEPLSEGLAKRITVSSKITNETIKILNQYGSNLIDTFIVILSPKNLDCVGLRFRCQINENSKMQGGHYIVPEFNHNGIVGIDGRMGMKQSILLLQTSYQHDRTSVHFNFLENNLTNRVNTIISLKSDKSSFLEQVLELTWILDYLSICLAQLQGIDPMIVLSIDNLKKELSNVKS